MKVGVKLTLIYYYYFYERNNSIKNNDDFVIDNYNNGDNEVDCNKDVHNQMVIRMTITMMMVGNNKEI